VSRTGERVAYPSPKAFALGGCNQSQDKKKSGGGGGGGCGKRHKNKDTDSTKGRAKPERWAEFKKAVGSATTILKAEKILALTGSKLKPTPEEKLRLLLQPEIRVV